MLVYSRTAGFRHDAIPAAVAALRGVAVTSGWQLDATEDPAVFTDAGLAAYDAVVFLLTTGDVLDDAQQGALERFVRARGGWVGVHSAADTEYDWGWYRGLVGATFASHPRRSRRRSSSRTCGSSECRRRRHRRSDRAWHARPRSTTEPGASRRRRLHRAGRRECPGTSCKTRWGSKRP